MSEPPGLPTPELARRVNEAHGTAQRAARQALEHARRAGELLLEAKARVGHGQWGDWIRAHCDPSPRTVRLYMQIAREWHRIEAGNGNALPIREAARLLRPTAKADAAAKGGPGDGVTVWSADVDGARVERFESEKHPGYAYLVRFEPVDDGFLVDVPRRPTGHEWIAWSLQMWGAEAPPEWSPTGVVGSGDEYAAALAAAGRAG